MKFNYENYNTELEKCKVFCYQLRKKLVINERTIMLR